MAKNKKNDTTKKVKKKDPRTKAQENGDTVVASPETTRRFSLMTYNEPKAIEEFLRRSPWVQHFALAHHDKDVWTSADEKRDPKHKAGEPKEPHTHVLLYTYSAKTVSAIIKNFNRFSRDYYKDGTPQNTFCEMLDEPVGAYLYLTHAEDPEKAQYSPDVVKTDDAEYWKKYVKTDGLNDPASNYGYQMFTDLLDGVSTKDMILRYGKEYIYHAKHFEDVISRHLQEDRRKRDEVSTTEEFTKSLSRILSFSSKYDAHQLEMFSDMLSTASDLLELWEGITYKVIKINKDGEILE